MTVQKAGQTPKIYKKKKRIIPSKETRPRGKNKNSQENEARITLQ